jgi:Family of unknown function (DUF6496)
MAKRRRKYSRGAGSEVKREMHRYKRGTAKSGRGGKGGKVKSRKQAIAIGLSKARKKGKKVPTKKSCAQAATTTLPSLASHKHVASDWLGQWSNISFVFLLGDSWYQLSRPLGM